MQDPGAEYVISRCAGEWQTVNLCLQKANHHFFGSEVLFCLLDGERHVDRNISRLAQCVPKVGAACNSRAAADIEDDVIGRDFTLPFFEAWKHHLKQILLKLEAWRVVIRAGQLPVQAIEFGQRVLLVEQRCLPQDAVPHDERNIVERNTAALPGQLLIEDGFDYGERSV